MAGLRIAHLYPEALNTGGDRGNILCMEKRLAWRGIDCTVDELRLGGTERLAAYDLLYIGGGQEFEREAVLARLRAGADAEIRAAIDDGTVVLATAGGFQLMGQYFETKAGDRFAFLGAADFHTVEGTERFVGNYAFRAIGGTVPVIGLDTTQLDSFRSRDLSLEPSPRLVEPYPQVPDIVGFENHSGRTYLAEGTQPLGTVLVGHGNNGEDGTEGVRHRNLFGCYAHGPLLPKNPQLCDLLLATALKKKYGDFELAPLPDGFETLAHDTVLAKTMNGSLGRDA